MGLVRLITRISPLTPCLPPVSFNAHCRCRRRQAGLYGVSPSGARADRPIPSASAIVYPSRAPTSALARLRAASATSSGTVTFYS